MKKARIKKGYTQETAARILGVSRTSYSKYENNVHCPDRDTLVKISKLFDCSVDYLLDIEDAPDPDLSSIEKKVILTLRCLSLEGQKKALDYVIMLKVFEESLECSSINADISDSKLTNL